MGFIAQIIYEYLLRCNYDKLCHLCITDIYSLADVTSKDATFNELGRLGLGLILKGGQ